MLAQVDWITFSLHVVQGFVIIFVIWLVQAIINKFIKKKFATGTHMPKDAVNGVVYCIRIIFACIILFVFLSYFGFIDAAATLNITAVLATAIGFSLTIAVGNFVAGLYLIASRPYQVGDYLRMGPVEGFVTEIGLNFTTIRDPSTGALTHVPNRVAMNENLWVYKVPRRAGKGNGKKRALLEDTVVRYIMAIESELSIPPRKTLDIMGGVCERWAERFGGYVPRVRVQSVSFRVRLQVVITADDMATIQGQAAAFLDDVWDSLHGPAGGVGR